MNKFKIFGVKHAKEIFMALGIGAQLGALAAAITGTPKVLGEFKTVKDIYAAEDDDNKEGEITLPLKVSAKILLKHYWPAILSELASVFFIFMANKEANKQIAALSTAVAIGEQALVDYKDQVVEALGEKAKKTISVNETEKKVAENPPEKNDIFETGHGSTLFLDDLSGRYFYSDRNTVDKCVNDANHTLLLDMYLSVNEFYSLLDLPPIGFGKVNGWNISQGQIEVDYIPVMTPDGRPCISVNYNRAPCSVYMRL